MASFTGDIDYPMVIVTAAAASGERSGCLVGFHTQCSIDPPRWAVWISKANHTVGVARRSAALAVHFLSDADRDIAKLFGEETGDEVDKFADCEWHEGPDGVPLLDRLPNRFAGKVLATYDAAVDDGDHQCFIVAFDAVECDLPLRQLGFQDVRDLDAGHPA